MNLAETVNWEKALSEGTANLCIRRLLNPPKRERFTDAKTFAALALDEADFLLYSWEWKERRD